MMYVLPPHLISLSLRSRLLELRSPISTCLLPNPCVIRHPRTSLPLACSAAASLSSRSRTRTRPCRGLDDDGPAAARIRPFGAVLVGGTPVHAGRQVQQQHGFLL